MSKRGIQFHDVGHGWTVAPFGVDTSSGWDPIPDDALPDEERQYLALFNGKRALYKGIPLNTQFCMSSATARKRVAEYIADYAAIHSNVDYIHVWLGDGHNNHCQCDNCAKKTVSDWYIMLLNQIDEALAAKKLNTRIVFIQYTETTWAPQSERINNPDRFTMMLAPISRSYTRTLTDKKVDSLPPFVRNNVLLPTDLDEYLAHFREWRKVWNGSCFCFEYHFWKHQIFDPSGMHLAKRIYEDIEAYYKNGVNGLVACGSQRSYFPTGFAYYVFARKQYDITVSLEQLIQDYFTVAFGNDWQEFVNYLYNVANCFGAEYFEGEEMLNGAANRYYNPERAQKLGTVKAVTEKGKALISEHYNSADRVKTVSVRLLEEHARYIELLAEAFMYKANGETEMAKSAFSALTVAMSKREPYIEKYFEHDLAIGKLKGIINS